MTATQHVIDVQLSGPDQNDLPVFKRLAEEEQQALNGQIQWLMLDAQEPVPFTQEDEPAIWIIRQGHISLTYIDSRGRQSSVLLLEPGDFFGSYREQPDPQFAEYGVALTPVCLGRLPRRKLVALAERYPAILMEVTLACAERIERLQIRIANLMLRSVEERLAILLLELGEAFGKSAPDGMVEIELSLAQRDLAQMVGASREMVTHVLKRFRSRGMVATSRRHYRILRPKALEQLAGREAA